MTRFGLRARLRRALGRDAARDADRDVDRDEATAAWQALGAAVVASWEVAAAELNRALTAHPDRAALVVRFSDALVPTLDALRVFERDAAAMRGAGPAVATAWPNTVAWLAPVLDARGVAREPLLAVGRRWAAALDARAAAFHDALARGEPGLRALDTWRHGVVRDAEIELDAVRAAIAGA